MMATPPFEAIGDTGYDIQNIKTVEGFEGWGSESIQVLDTEGNVGETLTFLCEDNGYGPDGWYDENNTLSTRKIKKGEAFLIYTESGEGFKVNFAGQVTSEDTLVTGVYGFNGVGNNTPVQQDIQKLIPVSGFEGWGSESIQILDSEGNVSETLTFLCEDNGYGPDGWYDVNNNLSTRKLEPGEGFLIYTESDTFELKLPKAL